MGSNIKDISSYINLYQISEEGLAVGKNGTLTIGFSVDLPTVSSLTKDDIFSTDKNKSGLNLNPALHYALTQLTEGYVFHQQDIFFNKKFEINNDDDFLHSSVKRMWENEHNILDIVSYYFITLKSDSFNKEIFEDKNIRDFLDTVKNFASALDGKIPIKQLNREDWFFYIDSYFSNDFSKTDEKQTYDINFRDCSFGDNIIRGYAILGDKHIDEKIYSNIQTENSTSEYKLFNCWTYPLTWGIDCPKIVNNVIQIISKKNAIKSIKNYEAKIAFLSSAYSEHIKATKEYCDYIEADNAEFQPILHNYSIIYIYPKDMKLSYESKISNGYAKLKLKPLLLTEDLQNFYCKSIGSCASEFEAPLELYPSFLDEAICFSNLEGNYIQGKSGILVADIYNKPIYLDMIDEPYKSGLISNWNWLIIGPSGTGKSVLTNKMVSSMLINDFFFFIVDIGGSYKSLCNLHSNKSRYIELDSEGKNISFNPFLLPLVPVEDETLKDEIDVIIDLLLLAWDPNNQLAVTNPNSRATLGDILNSFYSKRYNEKTKYVNFESIYDYIKELNTNDNQIIKREFFNANSFLLVMKQYLPNGIYGGLFNGKDNILNDDNISIIVFEMENISEKKTLFKIILSILMIMAKRAVFNSKYKHKFVWLDEAWSFLAIDEMGVFLKSLFKTIRKKDGGVGIIVQDIPDIINSPHSGAIINNSATKILLSHEDNSKLLAEHKEKLSLTESDVAKICTIKKKDYCFFIKQGTRSNVYKTKISKEENLCFSSKKNERDELLAITKKYNGNVELAIEYIVNTKHQ